MSKKNFRYIISISSKSKYITFRKYYFNKNFFLFAALSFLVALAVYAGCTVADEATTDKPAQTPLQVMSNSNANFSNDLFKVNIFNSNL